MKISATVKFTQEIIDGCVDKDLVIDYLITKLFQSTTQEIKQLIIPEINERKADITFHVYSNENIKNITREIKAIAYDYNIPVEKLQYLKELLSN